VEKRRKKSLNMITSYYWQLSRRNQALEGSYVYWPRREN
jgi:hypothetical protein